MAQSITVGEGGRFVIPAACRKELGIGIGDKLIIRVEDGEIRLFQQKKALEELRKLMRPSRLKGAGVDDFLAFRKIDSRDHDQNDS